MNSLRVRHAAATHTVGARARRRERGWDSVCAAGAATAGAAGAVVVVAAALVLELVTAKGSANEAAMRTCA